MPRKDRRRSARSGPVKVVGHVEAVPATPLERAVREALQREQAEERRSYEEQRRQGRIK